MNLRFTGESLSGKKLNGIRIFLKTKDVFPKWTECKPETVKQIK